MARVISDMGLNLRNRRVYPVIRPDFFVYQKGDIVKDPTKSISFVPKLFQGWGGVGYEGVVWVIQL